MTPIQRAERIAAELVEMLRDLPTARIALFVHSNGEHVITAVRDDGCGEYARLEKYFGDRLVGVYRRGVTADVVFGDIRGMAWEPKEEARR